VHNTQQTQEMTIHILSGIRARNPATEQPQNHALDRTLIGIEIIIIIVIIIIIISKLFKKNHTTE
jgi:hypothetical protein